MKKITLIISKYSTLALVMFFPFLVAAQAPLSTPKSYTLLAPLPFIGEKVTDLSVYLAGMYKLGIGLAAAFAVLMIVWGGVEYIWSVTPGSKGNGLAKINNAILGLLLALGSYLLLYTISPSFVNFSLKLDDIKLTGKALNTSSAETAIFNREAIAQLTDLREKEQKLEDIRNQMLDAEESNDGARLGELNDQATDLERSIAFQKSEQLGKTHLRQAVTQIRNSIATGDTLDSNQSAFEKYFNKMELNQTSLDSIATFRRNAVADYTSAIEILTRLRDPIGAEKMREQKFYAISTIDSELVTRRALVLEATYSTRRTATADLQKARAEVEQMDTSHARSITEPQLKAQFIAESKVRLESLDQALRNRPR